MLKCNRILNVFGAAKKTPDDVKTHVSRSATINIEIGGAGGPNELFVFSPRASISQDTERKREKYKPKEMGYDKISELRIVQNGVGAARGGGLNSFRQQ